MNRKKEIEGLNYEVHKIKEKMKHLSDFNDNEQIIAKKPLNEVRILIDDNVSSIINEFRRLIDYNVSSIRSAYQSLYFLCNSRKLSSQQHSYIVDEIKYLKKALNYLIIKKETK